MGEVVAVASHFVHTPCERDSDAGHFPTLPLPFPVRAVVCACGRAGGRAGADVGQLVS